MFPWSADDDRRPRLRRHSRKNDEKKDDILAAWHEEGRYIPNILVFKFQIIK
ncbi:hypothetical protein Phum_PHUM024340 [Pediculus humanus corporis]|uniref:Uncharacterized protein n=1 Tax=Pediculus humanus subsp. corporis TaxID=121224 RepID=E0V9Z1_PEDHC|nr:uncharacterized protein Phum_PHUM024340 [Pediculus humanus corporis]EEB10197.1 hypothetical protein Phum_PHUM024340 [Pediculus humanus corporis]